MKKKLSVCLYVIQNVLTFTDQDWSTSFPRLLWENSKFNHQILLYNIIFTKYIAN